MISILLVEPHQDTRELYAETLRAFGFRVLTANDADDACEQVARAAVLVTGVRIPGRFDGIGLVRWVRSHAKSRTMSIIVLTACADAETKGAAMAAGCDAFLVKPCLPIDLATEVRHVAMMRSPRTSMLKVPRERRDGRSRKGTKSVG